MQAAGTLTLPAAGCPVRAIKLNPILTGISNYAALRRNPEGRASGRRDRARVRDRDIRGFRRTGRDCAGGCHPRGDPRLHAFSCSSRDASTLCRGHDARSRGLRGRHHPHCRPCRRSDRGGQSKKSGLSRLLHWRARHTARGRQPEHCHRSRLKRDFFGRSTREPRSHF